MPQLMITDSNEYVGITPSVLKSIDESDVNITSFKANKLWTVYSGSSTSNCLPLNAIYSDYNILPALGSELTYNDANNVDGSLQSVIYYSINHIFYKHKINPYETIGQYNLQNITKNLYQSASILSFPYVKVGEGVKPTSFELSTSITRLTGSTLNLNLKSDRYGNIYDSNLNTNRIISNTKFYEGFNEYFDISRISYDVENDYTQPYDRYISGSINFVPGVLSNISQSIGLAAEFDQSGIMVIKNDMVSGFYDRNHDYAISFFVSASNIGNGYQLLIGKSGTRSPYDIVVMPNKKIGFYMHGTSTYNSSTKRYISPIDTKHINVTSSTAVTSSWNHVVCQKSGSYMQIYVNGVLQANKQQPLLNNTATTLTQSMAIDSNGDIFVGGWNIDNPMDSSYYGKLDELRIYNKSLTSTEISYLKDTNETGSLLQTNIVGNIYHKQGLAVISSPNSIYNSILQSPYTASYKSTVTKYELSTIVRIQAADFNMSLNPSVYNDDGLTYQDHVTSSLFSPYITTIGLYDQYGRMLAIGKLPFPLKKRDDIDTNILFRIDLDRSMI